MLHAGGGLGAGHQRCGRHHPRDAFRAIIYVLVREVNKKNGGPEQIRTLKTELERIARDLPSVEE